MILKQPANSLRMLSVAIIAALSYSGAYGVKLVANPYHRNWQCDADHGQWVCHQTRQLDSAIYNPHASEDVRKAALASALGWVSDNSNSPDNCAVCGGHYYEPKTPASMHSIADSSTQVIPGHTNYKVHGALELSDGVVVTQPGRKLYANTAIIYPNLSTGKLEKIHASGNIRLRQPQQLLLARRLDANLVNHQADMQDAHYLIQVSPDGVPGNENYYDPNFTGYAHGYAASGKQLNQNQYILHDATYSTCPPTQDTWKLQASEIDLNQTTGRGEAYNTVLKIHGIPVFYSPYFNFPINNQRKTGFLYGSASYSNNNGAELYVPYYLNLAPNYDDLLGLNYYSKRGILWRNTFRYLTQSSSGEIEGGYIYKDDKTKQNRYRFAATNTTNLTDNLTFHGVYNRVSDQNYLGDFSQSNNAIASNTVLLPRQAGMTYSNAHWNVNGLVSTYQIVNQSLSVTNRPYERLPQFTVQGQYPYLLHPLTLSMRASYSNFIKDAALNSIKPVNGQRFYAQPTIGLNFFRTYGYLRPSVSLSATQYQLNHYIDSGFPDKNISRTLPIVAIDSALFFNRDLSLWGNHYSQTLEPRLYYLYVPYRNQNNIPIFDSSISTFNLQQMFSTNRFTGEDRIGNNNRLSAALYTTLNNAKGQQIFSGAIGQAVYFTQRRNSICGQGTDNNQCIENEDPDYRNRLSDLVAQGSVKLYGSWYINSQTNYSYHRRQIDYFSSGLGYRPDPQHLFNISYEINQFDYGLLSNEQILSGNKPPKLSQINTSFLWKLTPNWSAVASWDYSINNDRTISEFGGLQYDSCCWAIRFLAYRYISNSDPNEPQNLNGPTDTAYMVQFELKGLGSTSSSQLNSLVATIPGYNTKYSGFK